MEGGLRSVAKQSDVTDVFRAVKEAVPFPPSRHKRKVRLVMYCKIPLGRAAPHKCGFISRNVVDMASETHYYAAYAIISIHPPLNPLPSREGRRRDNPARLAAGQPASKSRIEECIVLNVFLRVDCGYEL